MLLHPEGWGKNVAKALDINAPPDAKRVKGFDLTSSRTCVASRSGRKKIGPKQIEMIVIMLCLHQENPLKASRKRA